MIQIENTLVSFDIFEKKFCCDLQQCKGKCCVEGDAGAPMEMGEKEKIEDNYERIKPYMKSSGITAVEQQGWAVIDVEGDLGTPLIQGGECAYAIEENGSCWCAIEKAWTEGMSTFRKPLSCHLYPIRVTKYDNFEALNYNKWKICSCARVKGEQEGISLYRFLKDALVSKYGLGWYEQLDYAANEMEAGRLVLHP